MTKKEKTFFWHKTINCPHCHKDIDLSKIHISRTKVPIKDKRVKITDFAQLNELFVGKLEDM